MAMAVREAVRVVEGWWRRRRSRGRWQRCWWRWCEGGGDGGGSRAMVAVRVVGVRVVVGVVVA
jgi:hypothetical protein